MARFGPGVGGGAMAMIPSAAKLRARFRGKLPYQISPHQTLPRQTPPPPALEWNDCERFSAC